MYDLSTIWQGDKVGFANAQGELVIPCVYDDYRWLPNGIIKVELVVDTKDGKEVCRYGLYNQDGEVILPAEYEMDDFYNGFAKVKKDEKYGIINANGEFVIPLILDAIAFSYGSRPDSLAKAEVSGMWCYFNQQGKVVECLYRKNYLTFILGKAEVTVGDDTFYIDRRGKRLDTLGY